MPCSSGDSIATLDTGKFLRASSGFLRLLPEANRGSKAQPTRQNGHHMRLPEYHGRHKCARMDDRA